MQAHLTFTSERVSQLQQQSYGVVKKRTEMQGLT